MKDLPLVAPYIITLPGNDILLCRNLRIRRRNHDDLTTAHTLSEVVVRFTGEVQRHALGEEGTETLSDCSAEVEGERIIVEPFGTEGGDDLTAEGCTDRAVTVVHIERNAGLLRFSPELLEILLDNLVEAGESRSVTNLLEVKGNILFQVICSKDRIQTEACCLLLLPVGDVAQHIDPADHLFDSPESEHRHILSEFLCDIAEEFDDELCFSSEELAEFRILSSNSEGTGVQVALSHHDTPEGDQQRGTEPVLLGTEEGCYCKVTSGLQVSVGLDDDLASQLVEG